MLGAIQGLHPKIWDYFVISAKNPSANFFLIQLL